MSLKDNYGAEMGMRITCQICGEQIFLAQIGYNSMHAECNDRHSLNEKFEECPKGWEINRNLGGWICPFCGIKFARIIENFKSELKETTLQRELI